MYILTINACILLKGIGFTRDDKKEERLKKMRKIFSDYDIVCIQELWECFWGHHHQFYKDCINDGWFVAKTDIKGITNTGNVILSKMPINRTGYKVFKHSGDWQRVLSNGILWAEIDGMHIFTTHLHSDTISGWFSREDVREKQLKEVKKFMNKHAEERWMLCGDFNIEPNTPMYDKMVRILGSGSVLERRGFPNTYNGRSFLVPPSWKERSMCIDHVFTNMEIKKCSVLVGVNVSDHYPLAITMDEY